MIAVQPVGDQPLRVEVINTLDGMEALASDWSALEARTPEATGFQSFAWCHGWMKAALGTGKSCAPRIVAVYENGRLVMLWPVQTTKFPFVTVARWIGEPITQYGDILAEEGHARFRWRKAAEQVILQWSDVDLFLFARLRADGVFVRSGGVSSNEAGSHLAPFVDLQGSLEPAHRHKSLERRAKQLAKLGAVRFAEITEPDQREEMTRLAITMKLGWLRSRRRFSAALSDSTVVQFLTELARNGFLRIHCVWVDNRVAAIELGFGGATHRSLLGCFDVEFAEGSPGHTLTSKLIDRLRSEGATRLDLLWPSEGYKSNFATGATPIVAHVIPTTLRGRAAAFAIEFLRRLVKKSFIIFFMPRKREERLVRTPA